MDANGLERLDIPSPFGSPVFRIRETPSTMEEARRLASGGAESGTAVAADFQTAGRGRFRDRSWSGERGRDLMFTIFLRLGSQEAAAFPLKAGLAVCLAIEGAFPGLSPRVKWPNDVLLGDRKLCGVLCESSGSDYFAGIGINCARREFARTLRRRAVSLEEAAGAGIDRFALLQAILVSLHRVLHDPSWLDSLNERLSGRGDTIRFLEGLPEDGRIAEGILSGLGPGGELLIDLPGQGVRPFVSGEILNDAPAL